MKVIKYNVDKQEEQPTKSSTLIVGSGGGQTDWFYFDGDNVHCRYNLIGDLEVAAYGDNSGTDKLQKVILALNNIDENSNTQEIATALVNIKNALTQ